MRLFKDDQITKSEFMHAFKELPKAELHLHLEAVVSRETVRRFYLRRHPELSDEIADEEINKIFTYSDLNGFINAYIAIQDLYENVDDLDYVFADLKNYLVRNGIVYAEVFAAPSAFMKKGFDFSKMVELYRRNILKIKSETGIIVRILIDVSRTFGMENAEKNLQLLLAYRVNEIIGIGLGGSEQKGPAKLFGDVFTKARENNLVTVAHAGEDVGPESIWDAIEILNVSRIGHGIAAMNDETLMHTLAERKIPLEICPTSNIFTKKFVKDLSEHPMKKFFDKGIVVTLNTDDPLFFGVELLDEYWNAYSKMGFKLPELKQILQNSFIASFMSESQKGSFLASLDLAWENCDLERKKKLKFEMGFVKRSMTLIGAPVAAIFILTTLIVTGVISKFTEQQAYRLMYSNIKECVLSFEKTLSAPSKITESIAWLFKDGFFDDDEKNIQVFENISQVYSDFPGFYGCRSDGTLFCGPNIVPPENYKPLEEEWYTGAVDYGGEMFYSDVYESPLSGSRVVTISRVIFKGDSVDGVVAFDFPLTDLQNFVGEIKSDELDRSFILSPEGYFFMHEKYMPNQNILTVENGIYHDLGETLLLAGDDFVYGKAGDIDYVFRICPIPITGWYYVLGKSIKDVNSFSSATRLLLSVSFFVLFFVIMTITALIISRMKSKEQIASYRLIGETHNLAVSSKENAATAQEQNAAVKEIVATMEDNTALSEDISQKIKDVSGVAKKTSVNVTEGVSYLEENVRQLHEIANANQATINGIKDLGDKIENIWDIVTLINSVADQAKIIAFNAELEASTAGAAGRNFHIVATEIRRLADGIIDGTKEIKSKITEIQQSSDSLILASESGTEKIQEGVANAKNLEERFSSIKNASEITADSAGAITTIIQQQTVASEQILLTLRQIASGVENFSSATAQISVASETLKAIAEDLNK